MPYFKDFYGIYVPVKVESKVFRHAGDQRRPQGVHFLGYDVATDPLLEALAAWSKTRGTA